MASSSSSGLSTINEEGSGSSRGVEGALLRLIEKQEEELETLNDKIELWIRYKNDYLELKALINQMQDKVRHPYRIPIAGTQLAFTRGHIIHTNELNVLLGDNYFVLRSSRQADQIINRRLENIEKMLKDSIASKQKTENWLKATHEQKREKEEFVEIVETM